MTDILTPEQIACIKEQWPGMTATCPWDELLASHEALRTESDSWQATAEELGDKNVNKTLADRHKMREKALRKQLAEAKKELTVALVALRRLVEAAKEPLDDMDKYQRWPPGQARAHDHVPYYYLRCLIAKAIASYEDARSTMPDRFNSGEDL